MSSRSSTSLRATIKLELVTTKSTVRNTAIPAFVQRCLGRGLVISVLVAGLASLVGLLSPPVHAQAGPPIVSCPAVNMVEYVAPNCNGSCPHVQASSIGDGFEWHTVDNYVENIPGTNLFKQHSNEIHFLYRNDGANIRMLQDSIWNPFVCDDNQADAMNRTFDVNGTWGGKFVDTSMSCGAITKSDQLIRGYEYNPAIENEGQYAMDLRQCRVGNFTDTPYHNEHQMFYALPEGGVCNGASMEGVIGVTTISGPGSGEVFFYCKGLGLCAWYQSIDWSDPNNDPTSWDENTDYCDLTAGKRRGDYYLYPLAGLSDPEMSTTEKVKTIQNDLVQQGYELSCTTPALEIKPEIGGAVNDFFDQGGATTLPIDVDQVFDFSGSNYPLFRSKASADLMSSLESYYGVLNLDEDDPRLKDISSAALYRMMNPVDLCKQQVKMLEVVESMCNKLKEPDTCALAKQIPGTEYSMGPVAAEFGISSLLQDWRSLGITCENLRLTDLRELPPDEVAHRAKVRDGLMRTPLFLDKAYRLAFLVVTTELQNPIEVDNRPNLFNFLRRSDRSHQPKHEVKVVAFKVPDIGTNKYLEGELSYRDPLQVTRDAMYNKKDVDQLTQMAQAERDAWMGKLANPPSYEPGMAPVECGDAECMSLADPLPIALAQMVNANGQVCSATAEELKAEPVNQIKDKSNLGDNQGSGIFKPDFKLLENLFSKSPQKEEPDIAQFEFLSNVRIQEGVTGPIDKTTTRSYLIYPVGFELKSVEDALAAVIYTDEEILAFKNNPDNLKYYKMLDTNISVEGRGDQGFTDRDCISSGPQAPDDENAPADPCRGQVTAEVTADTTEAAPRVWGGWLGIITRRIQENLQRFGTPAFNYLRSCQTTEDFLLGRCSGGTQPGLGDLPDSGDKSSQCLEVWVSPEQKTQYATVLRTNLPGQQSSTPRFAGWLRYFGVKTHPEYQHIYGTCGGQRCYEYVLNRILNESDINPYLAIAIAFNETGGLYSAKPDQSGPHFGCAPWRDESIEDKLSCMINTLNGYRDSGLDSDAALRRYGYVHGYNNQNLNKLVGILSYWNYQGKCGAEDSSAQE